MGSDQKISLVDLNLMTANLTWFKLWDLKMSIAAFFRI